MSADPSDPKILPIFFSMFGPLYQTELDMAEWLMWLGVFLLGYENGFSAGYEEGVKMALQAKG